MEKREFLLEGLCCANCAAKIEKEVGELADVAHANINLMNSKLSVAMKEQTTTDLASAVREIVGTHEPSVKVIDLSEKMNSTEAKEQEEEEGGMTGYLIRIGIATVIALIFSFIEAPQAVKTIALLIAYGLAGYEVLMSAVKNIAKGEVFDENFLMSIASIGAFLINEQVEAVAVMIFYGIGELLQDRAVYKSRKNIAGLMNIRPDYANLITTQGTVTVSPVQVAVGDIILVKPGEKIPLDGIVVKGNSFIDSRALTGESVPREVLEGSEVLSGTVNTGGLLEIQVIKPFGESTVAKILELVENAGSKKAESEKFITKFARYYTPIVVFSAVAVAILPPILGFGAFSAWFYRALSFLIISCPCALVISIPLSFFGGIGGGAKHGILIKGGNYLDALKKVDAIVFDKTGTLTKGVFEVAEVQPSEAVTADELLHLAAVAESNSNHPIAKSILTYYERTQNGAKPEAAAIQELAGFGVEANIGEAEIYVGNEKLMKLHGIEYTQPRAHGSIVHVARDKQYLGYILITDELKPGVKETIHSLKQLGVKKTIMLSGDHTGTAKDVAEMCQIDEYHGELLPQDKVTWFEQYKKSFTDKGKIVFVGDGINDAPVLAGADIGIAMGGIGSDAAIEAADVVIMNDDISKLVTAVKVAKKTNRIVMQNIVFALGVKLLIMILAFFGITSIWFAIFADVGVALIALMNALRAMRIK